MAAAFREATSADVDLLLTYMRGLYAQDPIPLDEPAAREALAGLIGDPLRGRLWLIEDAGVPIGYAALTLGWSLEYHGRDAIVDELFVEAAHRGRGVGRAALAFLEERARALGVNALHLEVDRANVNAQRLYRRVGFVDHDRYLLTKWLR